MPKPIALRSANLRETIGYVDLKTARAMVSRGKAEWVPNTRSIKVICLEKRELVPEQKPSPGENYRPTGGAFGASASPGETLMSRYVSGQRSAIVAINAWMGPAQIKRRTKAVN